MYCFTYIREIGNRNLLFHENNLIHILILVKDKKFYIILDKKP